MQSKNRTHGVLIADVVESRSRAHLRSSLNEKLRIASIAQIGDKLVRIPRILRIATKLNVCREFAVRFSPKHE